MKKLRNYTFYGIQTDFCDLSNKGNPNQLCHLPFTRLKTAQGWKLTPLSTAADVPHGINHLGVNRQETEGGQQKIVASLLAARAPIRKKGFFSTTAKATHICKINSHHLLGARTSLKKARYLGLYHFRLK